MPSAVTMTHKPAHLHDEQDAVMNITIEERGGVTVASLAGEINSGTAETVQESLLQLIARTAKSCWI